MSESASLKVLMARAGDTWCALPLPRIRQVIHDPKFHPLPGAGEQIAGLAEVDGEPVVILHLERLINAPPGPAAEFPVTLLVEVGPGTVREVVGLVVDEAGDIVRLDENAVVGPAQGFVRGEAKLERGLVRLLDLTALGQEA